MSQAATIVGYLAATIYDSAYFASDTKETRENLQSGLQ